MKMSLFSVDIVRLGSGAEPLLVLFVFSPIVTEAIYRCNMASTAHFDDRQPPPQVFVDSGAKSAEKGACRDGEPTFESKCDPWKYSITLMLICAERVEYKFHEKS